MILESCSLLKNKYNGHALESTLAQLEIGAGYWPAVALIDKVFRAKKQSCTTEIVTLNRPKKIAAAYEKRNAKARFRRLAAVAPRIGYLKSESLFCSNLLKGHASDAINLLLTLADSSIGLWMRRVLLALVSAIHNLARECWTFRSPPPA